VYCLWGTGGVILPVPRGGLIVGIMRVVGVMPPPRPILYIDEEKVKWGNITPTRDKESKHQHPNNLGHNADGSLDMGTLAGILRIDQHPTRGTRSDGEARVGEEIGRPHP